MPDYSRGAPHRLFLSVSALLLAIVLIGFAPSFFLEPVFQDPGQVVRVAESLRGSELGATSLPGYVVVHGVLSGLWMLLFLTQAVLIASERRRLHMRLGVGGLFLSGGVAVSGIIAVLLALPRLVSLAEPPDASLVIGEQLPGFAGDLGTLLVFSVAMGGAGFLRRRPDAHRQLILLASMTLISPPLVRIWVNSGIENGLELWYPLSENTLAVAIIGGYWISSRRVPRVLLVGFVTWLLVYGAMTGLGGTGWAQSRALELMS